MANVVDVGYALVVFYEYIEVATVFACLYEFTAKPLVLLFRAAYVLRDLLHRGLCIDGHGREQGVIAHGQGTTGYCVPVCRKRRVLLLVLSLLLTRVLYEVHR